MTAEIPVSYDSTDVNSEAGILFGIPIQGNGIRTLCNNHNFIGGKYTPHFGAFLTSAGATTTEPSGSDWHNITGVSTPKQLEGRGIVCHFEASNASTIVQYVRINAGGTASSYVTIPAGSGFVAYTVELTASPTTSALYPVVLQTQAASALVHGWETMVMIRAAVFLWKDQSGTVGSNVEPTGFVYSQVQDHTDTEPLTVEQFNRFRGGPRVMFEAMPQVAASFTSQWLSPDNTNKTSRTLVGHLVIVKRRQALKVRFDAIAMGSALEIFVPSASGEAGAYHSITPSVSTSTTIYEADPSTIGVNSSSTVDFTNHSTVSVCGIYMTSSSTLIQARVFSVQGVIV